MMKSQRKRVAAAFATIALAAAMPMLAGCGEPAEEDPTPVKTFKITPAATSDGQTAVPEATSTVAPDVTPAIGGVVLELVGVSSTFDVTELAAPEGPITIKFDNREAGVIHNVAVYPGDDASQDPLGATELESGPIEQELSLTLEAGEYFYQCDVHPTTMKGTLKVS
jgi:plastocyanin